MAADDAKGSLCDPADELCALREELEKTRARLFRADRMAALGSMVAGIAHEINTPVGAIISMQDTLLRAVHKLKATLGDEYPDALQNRKLATAFTALEEAYKVIESGSSRVHGIVGRLRSFARLDDTEMQVFDLLEAIEDTLFLLHSQLKAKIEVRRNFVALPPIEGHAGQIKQVLLNLIVNARQAIEDRGVITISTTLDGEHVVVSVADTGSGISDEHLARLFEAGFTTKCSGTGLGLAICREIIEHHRGSIEVDSEAGVGTTFTLRLPINAAQDQH